MKLTVRLFLLIWICSMTTFLALAQNISTALDPKPRPDEWWTKRHAEKCELMKQGNVDLLMIGDSITHGWENKGVTQVWDKFYTGRKILNLGFSGDRTEHVLWRLQNSPLDAISPKAATIMIGTNNMGAKTSTPEEAAEGIRAIVDLLQNQYPDIKVFVLYVFPRDNQPDGALRLQTEKINACLPGLLGNYKNVTLIDINHKFLDVNGVLEPCIMPDFLHPNTYGYVLWGEAVEPFLKPIFD